MGGDELAVQAIGILGMVFCGLSFQQKKQRSIILFQMVGAVFFSAHYFLLGAVVGGMLNVVAILRALVYSNPERTHAKSYWWVALFTVGYLASYLLSFTVFGKAPTLPNLMVELLPVIAMVIATVSFRLAARYVRLLGLLASPLWLAYNLIGFSVGGILCESMNLVSILIGICRLDVKKSSPAKNPKDSPN